jgi:hypothetical protein
LSWSVTVNNLQDFQGLTLETQERFASDHPAYPRDAQLALDMAKTAGLKSAMLSGGRTPSPYGEDEIVLISVSGSPSNNDFLSEMRSIIASGPDKDTDIYRHYLALARLRATPCPHIFSDRLHAQEGVKQCAVCGVCLNGTMLYFEDDVLCLPGYQP